LRWARVRDSRLTLCLLIGGTFGESSVVSGFGPFAFVGCQRSPERHAPRSRLIGRALICHKTKR
jgi:hypothetical protein